MWDLASLLLGIFRQLFFLLISASSYCVLFVLILSLFLLAAVISLWAFWCSLWVLVLMHPLMLVSPYCLCYFPDVRPWVSSSSSIFLPSSPFVGVFPFLILRMLPSFLQEELTRCYYYYYYKLVTTRISWLLLGNIWLEILSVTLATSSTADWSKFPVPHFSNFSPFTAGTVEYTDCFSAEG